MARMTTSRQSFKRHLRPTDLRAATLLATQATQAITNVTEGVHQAVRRSVGVTASADPARTNGLTGLIYKGVRGVTAVVGKGVVRALTQLEPWLPGGSAPLDDAAHSAERLAVLAALNGVMGDRLAANANPLALPMTLRVRPSDRDVSRALQLDLPLQDQLPHASPHMLLVLHGLCMNDLQWQAGTKGQQINHAQALAQALGMTPVYLRYNTGLHISQNGRLLAQQLQALLDAWPVPLTGITMLAHSMGGLVARSAVHVAQQELLPWADKLQHLVFLGTPHHGAPLERAGNWVDVLLGSTPYTRPFARLGQLRSAGVTDLRYGLVYDADWQGKDRFRRQPDCRTPLPLPTGVACYAVAGTLAGRRNTVADRLVGDGLVPLHSALGQHDDPRHTLLFDQARQLVVPRCGHLQLLSHPQVQQALLGWLAQT